MSDAPKNTWDQNFVDDVTEHVYRNRLEADNPAREIGGRLMTSPEIMIMDDGDSGEKLRRRAVSAYSHITRAYIEALGIRPVKPNDRWEPQ